MKRPINFTSYVVKVASRCNLNCDYCYVYNHADQSWKNRPKTLSLEHQELFADRLREYILEKKLEKILVIFHGGEPLLFGADNLVEFARKIRSKVPCKVEVGIQTNGVLLKEDHLKKFDEENISVSFSIDGPREMHDQHRLDLKKRPTFDKVYQSLLLLKKYPKIFSGCISVIDPNFDPRKLFKFFDDNEIKEISILLPDANYEAPPKGRDANPNLYKDWLIRAFDCWFDEFSHIKCKYFDWLLRAIMGHVSETDSFGLGDISLLVLETDGTYHNHDVLKITEDSTTELGLCLENNRIIEVETNEKIVFHRRLLVKEGLSSKCQSCKHVEACGAGFIGHRYSKEGYKNPSIYCDEIYSLIDHIIDRSAKALKQAQVKQVIPKSFTESEMKEFWDAESSRNMIHTLQMHQAKKSYVKLQACLPYALKTFPHKAEVINQCQMLPFAQLETALLSPTVVAWLRAFSAHSLNSVVNNICGTALPADPDYFDVLLERASQPEKGNFVVQSSDRWYRFSLGPNIIIEHSKEKLQEGLTNLHAAFKIVKNYSQSLLDEMHSLSKEIQLVIDTSASPDKDVSFSDETMLGAIFIGVWKSSGLHSPYVVAASLIHEHLHQKLYLLQSCFELFYPQQTMIFSPWPNVLRPPSGALHAVYVFTHVAHFWKMMIDRNEISDLAQEEFNSQISRLAQCLKEINEKVHFTPTGKLLFNCTIDKFKSLSDQKMVTQNGIYSSADFIAR